jgi:large subunit ribosomal protein L2
MAEEDGMGIRIYKPTSAGKRGRASSDFEGVSKKEPEKSLTKGISKTQGHGNTGRITSRFRGGGHKRLYREIEFRRAKTGVPAKVVAVEYDPNRTSHIALLQYVDGQKTYILAPAGLKAGDSVIASSTADIKPGNNLPLKNIPVGTMIHNIELKPGKGGQMVRTAGSSAQLMAREGQYAQVRLPSGDIRLVLSECTATIGQVGNAEHELVKLGKAGRARWLGRRPHQRGVSMNPIDHPHGGGEGRTSGGRNPVTPWGKPTKGHKTRHNKRTDRLMVRSRNKT